MFLREEEKLARDVYAALYEKWNMNIFNNIASSEQTHTDRVKAILDARNIEDPVTDDTRGVFKNEELSKLYTDLVQQGSASLVEALKVGALIEDLDIKDLNEMASRTNDTEVITMYMSLRCGSENHMRSFVKQIEQRNATYEPTYISQAEYDAIVTGSNGECN